MEQITITAKIQILPGNNEKSLINDTMSAYTSACNYVSNYVLHTQNLKQTSLNKALYYDLRKRLL